MHSELPLVRRDGMPVLPAMTPQTKFRLSVKRLVDFFCSLFGLLFFSPMMLVIAAAIRLSDGGPALFVQMRPGVDGRMFRMLKFRSMALDRQDITGVAQVQAGDTRVTPIGRFLRKTSLDELPQLINVLLGQMSLVGPRPHVVGMKAAGLQYEDLVPYYSLRRSIKPGITGWAQVNGLRGSTESRAAAIERIEHDLAYIQNQSFWLDLKIIVGTIRREFLTGTGS